jgi:hypothetical protein
LNGVLLRGLPFEDADRLVYLERLDPQTPAFAALPLGNSRCSVMGSSALAPSLFS